MQNFFPFDNTTSFKWCIETRVGISIYLFAMAKLTNSKASSIPRKLSTKNAAVRSLKNPLTRLSHTRLNSQDSIETRLGSQDSIETDLQSCSREEEDPIESDTSIENEVDPKEHLGESQTNLCRSISHPASRGP